jgi:pyrimidine deaminase RibD-like protein
MLSYGFLARRVARRSGRHPKYKMAAVVLDGTRILAVAANGNRRGRHAERRALARSVGGDTLVVARHDGGHSRPCRDCQALLRERGIRHIWYYDVCGQFVYASFDSDGNLSVV